MDTNKALTDYRELCQKLGLDPKKSSDETPKPELVLLDGKWMTLEERTKILKGETE
jgi:hypothetical protein